MKSPALDTSALLVEPVRRLEAGPWMIELLAPSPYEARYVASQSAVGFAFDSQRGTHAIGSDRISPFQAIANGLAFVPKGCDVFSSSAQGGEYLRVIRTDGMQLIGTRPFNNLVDPQAILIAQRMRKAFLNAAVENDWENWAWALAERASGIDAVAEPSRGSITARRLQQLDEFIDAGLESPLSVQAMAALLGLSEGYFIRAFREATGQSPHSYLIDRRLARARYLLRCTTKRVVDIAQACGFSSQAHMTTVFKQRLGTSPTKLRG
ncbi:helix-turn-helix transcriptional regulator [Pseudomonas sp. CDFA 602]|uniref:helix-turn-helix transcriptional regulator n=1 Tax=Pseudomonas californiensis TaxID=2829823 RepID=UPI001E62A594|nr:AraC family transcriptional regulator [Pseudomonas californiensis]MCD5992382.1 helix-turn-helix transcriptional regulator [Pseudomonas californiensis]MCD5997990.1 helix-turn-helix transcriptional regulator [Pseudomonas californiensis]